MLSNRHNLIIGDIRTTIPNYLQQNKIVELNRIDYYNGRGMSWVNIISNRHLKCKKV